MPLHVETPLVESRPLGLACGRRVWLKLEALQPPGSFKIRGIGLACETYAARGARRFVCSSGGNAGIAVAYAARRLRLSAVVVVPETTSARARELLRQENAEVIVHGASWQEANALATSMVAEGDAFIHPFDDPLLWRGHATMVDEVLRAGLVPGCVVLCVGGGGLLCGVAEGMAACGWGDVPIVAVETRGAQSFHEAVSARRPVTLDRISSIATSLGARRVADAAFAWTSTRPIASIVVSDADALAACERFLDDHRLLVEPACGASLSLAYGNAEVLKDFDDVLVIACGGAGATVDDLRRWSAGGAVR